MNYRAAREAAARHASPPPATPDEARAQLDRALGDFCGATGRFPYRAERSYIEKTLGELRATAN